MTSSSRQIQALIISVALMLLGGFAPAIALGALGWKSGVYVAMLAGLASFVACMTGKGWHTGLYIAAPFAVFAALAVWVSPNALLAALVLAAAAFLRGYAARLGLHNALMMTVIALGFLVAVPPTGDGTLPAPIDTALIVLATTLWVTLVVFLARRWVHPPQLTGLENLRVLVFSTALALLVGVAAWFVVDLKLGHAGGWIILTILVVAQPSLGAGFKKAGERALGTVLGFLIAIVLGYFISSSTVLYVLGVVFINVAMVLMMLGKPYWLFATFLTPAIVLFSSAGATVEKVAEERLSATFIGIAATLLVMLALSPLAKKYAVTSQAAPA